jgi:hypothetical protein
MKAAPATIHRSVELHLPSRDQRGDPIDRQPWVELAVKTMSVAFGGAYEETVVGYWMDATGTCLREETSRIVSYAEESQVRHSLPRLLSIAAKFMEETNQAMVLVAIDGHPHPIPGKANVALSTQAQAASK